MTSTALFPCPLSSFSDEATALLESFSAAPVGVPGKCGSYIQLLPLGLGPGTGSQSDQVKGQLWGDLWHEPELMRELIPLLKGLCDSTQLLPSPWGHRKPGFLHQHLLKRGLDSQCSQPRMGASTDVVGCGDR